MTEEQVAGVHAAFNRQLANELEQRRIRLNVRLDELWRQTRDMKKVDNSRRVAEKRIEGWRQRKIILSGLPFTEGKLGVHLVPLTDRLWDTVTGYK